MLYRFIGEEGDPKEIVSQGTGVDRRAHGLETPTQVGDAGAIKGQPNLKQPIKVNPETGEVKGNNLQ